MISKRLLKRIIIALIVAFTGGEGYQAYIDGVPVGENINGVVVHIMDGDTLRINNIKIRLWGVDAPEKNQPGYEQATSILTEQAFLKPVSCTIRARDKYGRIVAQCFRDEIDVGGEVIRSGWARDYHRHSKGYYLKDESEARKDHKGLWKKA